MLKFAYEKVVTPANIRSSFKRAGIYPLNACVFLSSALLKHSPCMDNVLIVEDLESLFEEKRKQVRKEILGEKTTVGSTG